MNNYPKCFENVLQYKMWLQAERHSSAGQSKICTDCLPDYQRKMIAEKRCARPLTRFVKEHGELVGKTRWNV